MFSLSSETSSLYLKQRFDIYDTWNKYSKKGKIKKEKTDDQPGVESDITHQSPVEKQQLIEDKDTVKVEAIPYSPILEMSDDTQPKKKTKKHRKKKYKEIDGKPSSTENDTESKSCSDEDIKKEQRKSKKKRKDYKAQRSPKSDGGEPKKHRKRKKHAKSFGDEQLIVESDTALQSSETSIRKEIKKKKKRDKESKDRKRKRKEHSDGQRMTQMSASFLESASSETLRKRSKQKEEISERLSDDERFLEGADSPLMSLTDISSAEDKPLKSKGIFRRLFKW